MSTATAEQPDAPIERQVWVQKDKYTHDEILDFANRRYGSDLPPLPLPPLLMLHRIIDIQKEGGAHGDGYAIAEYDVNRYPDLFKYHFQGNPILPGALGGDAFYQLAGFYLVWVGARGAGMALGNGETKYRGMVTPDKSLVQFRIDVKQLKYPSRLAMIIADGAARCGSDKPVYEMTDVRVGVNAAK